MVLRNPPTNFFVLFYYLTGSDTSAKGGSTKKTETPKTTFRFRGAGISSGPSSDSPGLPWALPIVPRPFWALLKAGTLLDALGSSWALQGAPGRS